MPTIIPKEYYCPKCKKTVKGRVCDCGATARPVPPYTVRFRWISPTGEEEHKRLTGTPPWTTKAAAKKGYETWVAAHPSKPKSELRSYEFMPLYEEYKAYLRANVKESSYMAFTQRMDRFVVPVFKNKKVTAITVADIRKWQDGLTAQGFSYKYKSAIRGAFNHFFVYLKIYEIPNPISKVKSYKKGLEAHRTLEFWTEDEFRQFIGAADDLRYKTFFTFLYLTGCRKGEALALQWKDLRAGSVKIEKTVAPCSLDGKLKITSPKTLNSIRSISLPKCLVSLMHHYATKTPHSKTDFIFGGKAPFSTTAIAYAFDKYIDAAGVKHIRIHDLRHSHASLLINKGENALSTLYVIAARLGDTVEMILKTYGHLFPSNEELILQKLDTVL